MGNYILTYITILRSLVFLRVLNGRLKDSIYFFDIIIASLLIFPLGFIEWSILSLMETGIWIFLIVNLTIDLSTFYLLKKKTSTIRFCILLSLLILTRPESILYGLLFISIWFIQRVEGGHINQAIKRTVLPVSTYTVTLASSILWRIYYFGYPLPNTYYAKVSGSLKVNISGGLSYLFKFFYGYPQYAFAISLLFISAVFIITRWGKKRQVTTHDKVHVIFLIIILSGLLLPVLTGGDHFKFSRFYQCLVLIICMASFNLKFWKNHFDRSFLNIGTNNLVILTATVVITIFFIGKSTWYDLVADDKITANRILGDFQHARNGRSSASAANSTFGNCAHLPSIGVLAAGGFAYAYKGNTIDLMGLNSTIMAHADRIKRGYRDHASFSEKAFWKLLPDIVGDFYGGEVVRDTSLFVLPENTYAFRHGTFVYGAYKEIFDHPRFILTYLPALVRNKSNKFYFFAYYNRNFLRKLDPQLFEIILLQRKHVAAKTVASSYY